MERYGLKANCSSGFRIRLANHQKVKCLGMIENIEVEVFNVKASMSFHVMPSGLGAFPLLLGRPWLCVVGAIQDWIKGIFSLCNKHKIRQKYDMDSL